MSTTPINPTAAPTPATNNLFQNILMWAELATEVASAVPSPAQPFAAIALQVEAVLSKLITTQAAITGQTTAQVVAQLHQLPLP